MCSGESIRLLKRRENWQDRLREIFLSDDEEEYVTILILNSVSVSL